MASPLALRACERPFVVRSVDASDRSTPSFGRGESAKAKKSQKSRAERGRMRVERKEGEKSGGPVAAERQYVGKRRLVGLVLVVDSSNGRTRSFRVLGETREKSKTRVMERGQVGHEEEEEEQEEEQEWR